MQAAAASDADRGERRDRPARGGSGRPYGQHRGDASIGRGLRSERVSFAGRRGAAVVGGGVRGARAGERRARLEVDAAPGCSTRDELIARVAARSTRIRFVNDGGRRARPDRAHRGRAARRSSSPSWSSWSPTAAGSSAGSRRRRARRRRTRWRWSSPSRSIRAPRPARRPRRPGPATETDGRHGRRRPAQRRRRRRRRRRRPGRRRATRQAGTATRREPPAPAHRPADRRGRGRGGRGARADGDAGHRHRDPGGARIAPSILSPALVLTLRTSGAAPDASRAARRRSRSIWSALDACPVRVALLGLEARACAAGSLGRLAAQGSHTYDPGSVARPFATAGGTAAPGRAFAGGASSSAPGSARGRPCGAMRSEFNPEVFHRVASVTLVGDVGIGVRFP